MASPSLSSRQTPSLWHRPQACSPETSFLFSPPVTNLSACLKTALPSDLTLPPFLSWLGFLSWILAVPGERSCPTLAREPLKGGQSRRPLPRPRRAVSLWLPAPLCLSPHPSRLPSTPGGLHCVISTLSGPRGSPEHPGTPSLGCCPSHPEATVLVSFTTDEPSLEGRVSGLSASSPRPGPAAPVCFWTASWRADFPWCVSLLLRPLRPLPSASVMNETAVDTPLPWTGWSRWTETRFSQEGGRVPV